MEKSKALLELRQKAEEILKENPQQIDIDDYKENILKLVEELSVYQIELELQNKELTEKQYQLDKEKNRFADLYYNAPVGYLLLNKEGIIHDLNQKAVEILASENINQLKGKPFIIFLQNTNTTIFFDHIHDVFASAANQPVKTELIITNKQNQPKYLKLTSNILEQKYCRTLFEDITEQKTAENQIEGLNNRLQGSMRAGNMAWWELQLPSGKITFNKNKATMLGRNPDDFRHYEHFMNIVHPDDYEPTMEAFRKHLSGRAPNYECYYRIKHNNGHYLWFHDIGKIVKRNENCIKLTGIVTDVTQQKRNQQLLKDSEQNFKQLVEHLPHGIIQLNEHGQVVEWNSAIEEITGYKKNEVETKHLWEITEKLIENESMASSVKKYLENQIKDVLLNGKADWLDRRISNVYTSKNKQKRHVEVIHFLVPGGEKNRLGAILEDVTERVKMEQELAENKQRIEAIIKTLPDLLFHLDKNGIFLSFYQDATNLFKQPIDFLNKNVYDIFDTEYADDVMHCINQTLLDGHYTHDYTLIISEEERHFHAKYTKLNNDEVIALVSDVTRQKQAQQTIEKQNFELEFANATKDKLFNIIAHDLKNLFTSILGFSDLLVKNVDKYDKDLIKKYAGIVNSSSKNTYILLENLLEWARSQQGKIPFLPQKVQLTEIIHETMFLVKHQIKNKNIHLKTDTITDDIYVTADPEMLKTILRNLISNAIKFSHKNEQVEISITEADQQHYQIAVADNGVGMSPEVQQNLFKAAGVQSTIGTEGEKGTGFGLMISNEFVEKHNSRLQIQSQLNKGTTFSFRIQKA